MTTPEHSNGISLYDEHGQLLVMPSVYSVAFAETNATFDAQHLPARVWRVSANRDEFDEILAQAGLSALPQEGEKKLGLLDLIHVPIIDGIIDAVSASLPGIANPDLAYRYPLHGSAAGIGYLMGYLKVRLGINVIYTLAGDYEGYAAQATNYGLEVRTLEPAEALWTRGEYWFLSNPSAIDGEPLDDDFVTELVARNHVIFDVAYHGLHGETATHIPAGVWAVLWSLSKPWGLFWRRVGLLACRDEIPGAYGTRWFKDPDRLFAAYQVTCQHAPSAMSEQYRWAQAGAIDLLNEAGIAIEAASTVLLGRIHKDAVPDEIWTQVARAERRAGSGIARVCLTPLMEQLIDQRDADHGTLPATTYP